MTAINTYINSTPSLWEHSARPGPALQIARCIAVASGSGAIVRLGRHHGLVTGQFRAPRTRHILLQAPDFTSSGGAGVAMEGLGTGWVSSPTVGATLCSNPFVHCHDH